MAMPRGRAGRQLPEQDEGGDGDGWRSTARRWPWLGCGLAAEELERQGAEEGRDAVLLQQVQLDELGHRA